MPRVCSDQSSCPEDDPLFSVTTTSKLCICRLCPCVCLTCALARQSPSKPLRRRDSPGARGPFWVGGSGRVKPPGPRLLCARLCPPPRQEQGDPSAETGRGQTQAPGPSWASWLPLSAKSSPPPSRPPRMQTGGVVSLPRSGSLGISYAAASLCPLLLPPRTRGSQTG